MQTLHTILIIVIPILHNQLGNSEFSEEEQGDNLDSGRIDDYVHVEKPPKAMKQIEKDILKIFETESSTASNDDRSIAKQKEEQGDNLDSERSDDYVHIKECPDAIKQVNDGNCSKIFETVSSKTENDDGSIAKQKCNEYKEGGYLMPVIFGIGGVDASHLEFPHMAILGYGNVDNVTWQCGGSLISETFVLTAAHCINTRLGRVQHVKLGAHLLNTTNEREQSFNVEKVYTYPEYVRGRAYHDVALIRLDHAANIQDDVEPACLHTERELPKGTLIATGWGAVKLYGGIHNTLQKFTLQHVPVGNCSSYYRNQRTLNIGIIDDWQICADGGEEIVDTCQGDSGGPLQFKVWHYDNVYVIVGIVSTGLKCAVVPGIYTRVSHYVPWIESIVWPDE